MTYLMNNKGKLLYHKPANIEKASRKRKDVTFCKNLLKYNGTLSFFKMEGRGLINE